MPDTDVAGLSFLKARVLPVRSFSQAVLAAERLAFISEREESFSHLPSTETRSRDLDTGLATPAANFKLDVTLTNRTHTSTTVLAPHLVSAVSTWLYRVHAGFIIQDELTGTIPDLMYFQLFSLDLPSQPRLSGGSKEA